GARIARIDVAALNGEPLVAELEMTAGVQSHRLIVLLGLKGDDVPHRVGIADLNDAAIANRYFSTGCKVVQHLFVGQLHQPTPGRGVGSFGLFVIRQLAGSQRDYDRLRSTDDLLRLSVAPRPAGRELKRKR